MFTFNSLFEIRCLLAASVDRFWSSFNSLFEILIWSRDEASRGIRCFQFSFWDSIDIMREEGQDEYTPFNSLFEIRHAWPLLNSSSASSTFNSLFEIPNPQGCRGWGVHRIFLSILFLRFYIPRWPMGFGGLTYLSILFLRFAAMLSTACCRLVNTLSILFLRFTRLHPQPIIRALRDLSILFLRFFVDVLQGDCIRGRVAFNSLFEILTSRPAPSRPGGGLSILFLRFSAWAHKGKLRMG